MILSGVGDPYSFDGFSRALLYALQRTLRFWIQHTVQLTNSESYTAFADFTVVNVTNAMTNAKIRASWIFPE